MTTLKQGDLVKDKYGYTRKVMENCGTVLHISTFDKHDKYHCTTDEKTLKELGYTWDTPAWEPEALKVEINGKQYVAVDTKE